jgi:hypothetical protein
MPARLLPSAVHIPLPRVPLRLHKRQGSLPQLFDKHSDSSTASSAAPSTPKNRDHGLDNPGVQIAHTRTGSLPSEAPHQRVGHAQDNLQLKSSLKPSFITLPSDDLQLPPFRNSISETSRPPRISTSEAYLSISDDNRSGFRLSNLTPPWKEKRPKIYRCVSSPHLTTSEAPWSPPHNEQRMPSFLVKKKSKNLRKMPSVPDRPHLSSDKRKLCFAAHRGVLSLTFVFAGSTSCPVVAKKRPQPLRTQPYEAPYFFPSPVPTHDTPRRERPNRTRTLPPPQRRRSPPPPPPPVPSIPPGISLTPHTAGSRSVLVDTVLLNAFC